MLVGSFETLSDAWYYAIREIYMKGLLVDTEYNIKAKCINGMLLEIRNPVQVWHRKDPFCTKERIELYKKQFKRDAVGKHGFEYTYIDRLVNYNGFDQLKWMSEQLQRNRYESKRVQAITWMPEVDCGKKEDQPCFQRIWVFPYKNNKLDVHIHYRSWDMFKAFEANIIAFQELVKDELLLPTDFSLGIIRCFGDNVHIYEDDFQAVSNII